MEPFLRGIDIQYYEREHVSTVWWVFLLSLRNFVAAIAWNVEHSVFRIDDSSKMAISMKIAELYYKTRAEWIHYSVIHTVWQYG